MGKTLTYDDLQPTIDRLLPLHDLINTRTNQLIKIKDYDKDLWHEDLPLLRIC